MLATAGSYSAVRVWPEWKGHSSKWRHRPSLDREMIHRSRIGALRRFSVDDLETSDRRIPLSGHDLRGKREYLVWTFALVFPEPSDRRDSRKRLIERGRPVRRILGEQPSEGSCASRAPGRLVGRDPVSEPVGHAADCSDPPRDNLQPIRSPRCRTVAAREPTRGLPRRPAGHGNPPLYAGDLTRGRWSTRGLSAEINPRFNLEADDRRPL